MHIHTSENADVLNNNYDVKQLVSNIKNYADTENILISLTDHNVINKKAYMDLLKMDVNVIIGIELHIRNYEEMPPYHCHIYFDMDNRDTDYVAQEIDNINCVLTELYVKKMVTDNDVIPNLETIVKRFDNYDFVLLPHGGQSHRTFDKTIPHGVIFDTVIERNIYYNQFDGFTSRSNKGLETTQKYFKKLGIASFVNLITCTDNYNPINYPEAKSKTIEDFIPTWMLSEPTFSGLRLALSESSRLKYQKEEPQLNTDFIKKVKLKNELLDIDVELTQGLNVIIGGSSSGKTLFMDALYKKITNQFNNSEPYAYSKFNVDQIEVDNPAGYKPHYISQNYITKVIDEKYDEGIEKIDIIKNTFKGNTDLDTKVNSELSILNDALTALLDAVEKIEKSINAIGSIPDFPRIISNDTLNKNPYINFLPSLELIEKIKIDEVKFKEYMRVLDEIIDLSERNPFMNPLDKEINAIKNELLTAIDKGKLSENICKEIDKYKKDFDQKESCGKEAELSKLNNRNNLLLHIVEYKKNVEQFYKQMKILENFSFDYKTESIKSQGHELYIKNDFKLNKDIILCSINELLKRESKIGNFDDIVPSALFEKNFSQKSPKVKGYSDFRNRLYHKISQSNKKFYKIITVDNKDLDNLSPGWRTAIILDIVLGYEEDIAPIFIDQPEDNLATNYINKGLVDSIKKSKGRRQILIISHNATIPMLADAQNIIYCENKNGKIVIRSNPMEGRFEDKSVIDYIAEITDGGKASIKKRVKKYNLKKFTEDD